MAMDKEREALVERLRDDPVRAALLFCLWHHQGGSSRIGQAIRLRLGIGEYERLSDDQLATAKAVQAALTAQQEPVAVSIGSLSLQAELGAALGSALNHYRSKDMQACAASLVQIVGLFRAAPPSGVRDADGVVVPLVDFDMLIKWAGTDQCMPNEILRPIRALLAAAKEPRK